MSEVGCMGDSTASMVAKFHLWGRGRARPGTAKFLYEVIRGISAFWDNCRSLRLS
ncbi:hypothetical protein BDZ89DRAFT_1062724 [Hymenopellis radicata]|nr:hypothetical protein BDZ89DRAFT_1062724 [Hymenopellis radicata]